MKFTFEITHKTIIDGNHSLLTRIGDIESCKTWGELMEDNFYKDVFYDIESQLIGYCECSWNVIFLVEFQGKLKPTLSVYNHFKFNKRDT